jgi:hypothetical protein
MKNISLSIVLIISGFFFTNASAQTMKEDIKVWGNCGMCKTRIENAAKSAGAKKATWSPETHILAVTYKSSASSNNAIQEAIAKVGYDTQDMTGDNEAYNKLHGCCKYQRKTEKEATAKKCCAGEGATCKKDAAGHGEKSCGKGDGKQCDKNKSCDHKMADSKPE